MNTAALDALVTANPTADPAAILILAQADPRTVQQIPIIGVGLLAYMTRTGMLVRLQRSADAIASADQASADVLKSFTAYVQGGNTTFDTTDPTYAGLADQLFTSMVALNTQTPTLGVTAQEKADIIALGGGYAVKDATSDQVTASMARVAAANAANARQTAWEALNQMRFDADKARSDKLTYFQKNPTVALPADLSGLDAFTIPSGS